MRLRNICPNHEEVSSIVEKTVTRETFVSKYADVFGGDEAWLCIKAGDGLTFE